MRVRSLLPLGNLRRFCFLYVLVVPCTTGSFANDVDDIAVAKQKYEGSAASAGESARVTYVSKLAEILGELIGERMKTGKSQHPEYFDPLFAELKRHPAPRNSDSQLLSRLRVGKWESPRHDYLYRSDGTWCMLPYETGTTSGHWRIKCNQYFDGVGGTLGEKDRYTIILLTSKTFVFTNGTAIFYEERIEDHPGR